MNLRAVSAQLGEHACGGTRKGRQEKRAAMWERTMLMEVDLPAPLGPSSLQATLAAFTAHHRIPVNRVATEIGYAMFCMRPSFQGIW
jgi:hypothetical protein